MFQGPHAAEQILNSAEVDAVVIATPPYFHPQHLAAAVAAGKHVYCEKPVGVDVPGALRAIESGKRAEGRLSLDVGFQIRKAPPFVELVRRIHAGALGEIACGEAYYYCPFLKMPDYPKVSPVELRLRHWLHDRVLSGDIIVEQNIHVVDICNWVLQGHPVKAIGAGGRKGRTESPGDNWSHFDVVFYYPNDVHVSFSSCQFGKAPFEASERFLRHARQFPIALLRFPCRSPETSRGPGRQREARHASAGEFSVTGDFSDNLAQADSEKHADFIQSIVTANSITRRRWAPNRRTALRHARPHRRLHRQGSRHRVGRTAALLKKENTTKPGTRA
jgi:myo-inositol 2-dehydrogenase/D-chiro-inositol 1-dehydrogenase